MCHALTFAVHKAPLLKPNYNVVAIDQLEKFSLIISRHLTTHHRVNKQLQ